MSRDEVYAGVSIAIIVSVYVVALAFARHDPPITITPPSGFTCKARLFATKSDSLFYQVDCGR